MTDAEMIADERARIIRLEEKLEIISTISKGIWTLVVLFLVNSFGGIYALFILNCFYCLFHTPATEVRNYHSVQ